MEIKEESYLEEILKKHKKQVIIAGAVIGTLLAGYVLCELDIPKKVYNSLKELPPKSSYELQKLMPYH